MGRHPEMNQPFDSFCTVWIALCGIVHGWIALPLHCKGPGFDSLVRLRTFEWSLQVFSAYTYLGCLSIYL